MTAKTSGIDGRISSVSSVLLITPPITPVAIERWTRDEDGPEGGRVMCRAIRPCFRVRDGVSLHQRRLNRTLAARHADLRIRPRPNRIDLPNSIP